MREKTYYQRNKPVILKRTKDYYENNKDELRKRTGNKYTELSEKEKDVKRQYQKNRHHNV